MTQTETAANILAALDAAGEDAYLYVHTSGDVILWPDEAASVDDPGVNALARWRVTPEEAHALIRIGDYRIDVA